MNKKRIEHLCRDPVNKFRRLEFERIMTQAINEATEDAAIKVFVTREEARQDDAPDEGVDGWLAIAEQRIGELKLSESANSFSQGDSYA